MMTIIPVIRVNHPDIGTMHLYNYDRLRVSVYYFDLSCAIFHVG